MHNGKFSQRYTTREEKDRKNKSIHGIACGKLCMKIHSELNDFNATQQLQLLINRRLSSV